MTEITGRLFLHSETGTEGGWWAIQDDKFITPPAETPHTSVCKTCSYMWDFGHGKPEPVPSFTYYRDDWEADGKKYMGGYYRSEEYIEGGRTWFRGEEPGSFNDVWTRVGNQRALICQEYGHVWESMEPQESWSYEGLNYIQSGDRLEILTESGEVDFTIDVELVEQYDQYAAGARHANGWVIHSYPTEESYDFDKWCALFQKRKTTARLIRE